MLIVPEDEKWIPFEEYAEMYNCTKEDVNQVWMQMAYEVGNTRGINISGDDAVRWCDQNQMHSAMRSAGYANLPGYYTDDLGYIHQTKQSRIKKEKRSSVGVNLNRATSDALSENAMCMNEFVVMALKDYLTGNVFDVNERENYPKEAGNVFHLFNIPETETTGLTRACNGQRIKSKLVEIAIWRKLAKDSK